MAHSIAAAAAAAVLRSSSCSSCTGYRVPSVGTGLHRLDSVSSSEGRTQIPRTKYSVLVPHFPGVLSSGKKKPSQKDGRKPRNDRSRSYLLLYHACMMHMHAVIMAVLDLRIYLLVVPLALGPWAGRLPAGGCASGTISLGITSQLAEGVVVAHDILGRAE